MLKKFALDLSPLAKYRNFRLRTYSQFFASIGFYFTLVAAPLQVQQLTNDPAAAGLIGVVTIVPLIVCGLLGGIMADRFDRRLVAILSEGGAALAALGLCLNALLPSPELWFIYLIAAVNAGVGSIQGPSLTAMTPRYVAYEDLGPAASIASAVRVFAGLLGPAVGGIIAAHNMPVAYAVTTVCLFASLLFMLPLKPLPPLALEAGLTLRRSLIDMRDGIVYACRRRDLLGSYLVDTVAMLLAMPIVLFPFFAELLGEPEKVGYFYTAEAVGALVGTALSGIINHARRYGVWICLSAAAWGAFMGLAGLMPTLGWALVMIAAAGCADTFSMLFRGLLWNRSIPDELRGRLAGIELLSYSVGPNLGNARAGFMADAWGVRRSIALGGGLCVLGVAAVAAALPSFRRYDVETDEHALAQKDRSDEAEARGEH
ncbi:MFS transporter [Micrococcales bacterium 31B]|nr:MFS transporter [Micrococcales bacterium 31B]